MMSFPLLFQSDTNGFCRSPKSDCQSVGPWGYKIPHGFWTQKKRKIHRRIYPARKDQMAGSDATFKMFRISSLPVKFSHFWVFIYVSLLFFMSIILLRCDVLPELYRGPKKLFAKKGPPSIPMKNISIHCIYKYMYIYILIYIPMKISQIFSHPNSISIHSQ